MYAVIDVGSNSVRLMLSDGVNTTSKKVVITRLAQGLINTNNLTLTAVERTANAVCFFVEEAKKQKVDNIFIFATAGVRQAQNGYIFVDKVKELTGLSVDVISGETEAKIGALGALSGKDGGVIDIGGASTEISVVKSGKIVYNKSVDMGAVRLTEKFGQNREEVEKFVTEKIKQFSNDFKCDFYGIGGTATTLAGAMLSLEPYDPKVTHGYQVTKEKLSEKLDYLYGLSVEERKNIKGLHPERAEIITAGAVVLNNLLDYLNINCIIVSEKDNLEGYLMQKMETL